MCIDLQFALFGTWIRGDDQNDYLYHIKVTWNDGNSHIHLLTWDVLHSFCVSSSVVLRNKVVEIYSIRLCSCLNQMFLYGFPQVILEHWRSGNSPSEQTKYMFSFCEKDVRANSHSFGMFLLLSYNWICFTSPLQDTRWNVPGSELPDSWIAHPVLHRQRGAVDHVQRASGCQQGQGLNHPTHLVSLWFAVKHNFCSVFSYSNC